MAQRNYKATGINLKGMPMGEADRLVTVLTKEYGLVRAIAPGARKHKSKLAGRSGLFVVNEALFVKGKSLDKLVQAETVRSFPGLSKDLAKLTASQYLAEIVLSLALSEQPQEELYYLLIEHLARIEAATTANVLPCLAQATFHLLALAGVAPEVHRCCLSRSPLDIDLSNPNWRVAFSVCSGGAVTLEEIERLESEHLQEIEQRIATARNEFSANEETVEYATWPDYDSAQPSATVPIATQRNRSVRPALQKQVTKDITNRLGIVTHLTAAELALMQQLSKPELILSKVSSTSDPHFEPMSGTMKEGILLSSPKPTNSTLQAAGPHRMWRHIEQALRQYAQYQLDRPIRSAALIDTCFTPSTHAARA
ncbi:DNA repair protein RecO [cf. Phormidesmis sp. LEGE 11477]|uniref:DNA repair protein RecO n=1 Tax=cf. Phormidesmis sp. LEGE 11477 TaxID=1828680 RepID=UPI0018814114|nr:DNA repair protein RecO [cf. Phormidesmis sp. LEGE 11477]MBE9062914.1 DNA repair protein RecO [cf. Phormidesmis sp. LEGE 11477]